MVYSTSICSGESITRVIQAPVPAYTYNWYADAAHSVLIATGISFTTPILYTTTQYYVVAVSGGCMAETIITISVNTVIPPIVNDYFICKNDQHDSGKPFVENPQPNYIYNWYETQSSTTILYTGITYTTPALTTGITIYWVEAVEGNCKSVRTQDTVWLGLLPAISATGGGNVCEGNSAMLTIQSPVNLFSYQWSMGSGVTIASGIEFITPHLFSNTSYQVVAAYNLCRSYPINIQVNIIKEPPPDANDVVICPGTSAILSVENPAAATEYTWYQDSGGVTVLSTGINYTTIPLFVPNTFYVSANDDVCPLGSAFTPVSVNFPLLDSPIVKVAHVDFTSITFSWQTIAGASGYEVSVNGAPYVTPTSGNIGLTHTVSGLSHEQTVTIIVKPLVPDQFCSMVVQGKGAATTFGEGFYVPSAFSPNGDAINDVLKPIVPTGSILEFFTIYNRWGQMIFTTSVPGAGWDGKMRGKDQPTGTYVWMCRYLFAGKKEIQDKGVITLLR